MVATPRTALVVDDDRLLASLVASLLEDHGFVCYVAHDVSGARKILRDTDLDVALLDVNLGDGPSGVQFATAVAKAQPGIGIVFLTRTPDLVAMGFDLAQLPEGCGVAGKENLGDSDELLDAVESVLSVRRSPIRHDQLPGEGVRTLTRHQLEILTDVAAGLTNRAIAERHEVTERSVERSLQAVFLRLGIDQAGQVNPRVEAVRHYVEAFGFPPRSP
jgi:DNA-binding NarL/FixJ family response regulator